jgi:hypothetical protein
MKQGELGKIKGLKLWNISGLAKAKKSPVDAVLVGFI